MNYTSIEQSKKLLELGLSPETADMWYQHTGISIKDGSQKPIYFPMVIRDCESDEDIPCWSVGALLEVIPNIIFTKEEGNYSFGHPDSNHITESSLPIEAAYNMVVWLLENNYIKND